MTPPVPENEGVGENMPERVLRRGGKCGMITQFCAAVSKWS
jgi:hypothetical protein